MESNSKLVNQSRQYDSLTENNAVTHSTSLNSVVDMFFLAGASRNMGKDEVIRIFLKAFTENPLLAIKCLVWSRDIRGGAGERNFFHYIMSHLKDEHSNIFHAILSLIKEYGYWKDFFKLSSIDSSTLEYLKDELEVDNLLAKWFPRKGEWFVAMHNYLGITPKEFRKMLVAKSNTVEQQMCAREWDKIEYSKVPSIAFKRYKRAFYKRDEARFTQFIDRAVKGEEKISARAIFPYQLYQSYKRGDERNAINAQWMNLPDYVAEGSFIPVCDVSGSMTMVNGLPMAMSVSLGVYLSERNKSVFKDAFITFSGVAQMQYLKGATTDRFRQLESAPWGMNTNLQSVFKLILNTAERVELAPEDMPDNIIIISDMEFDQCAEGTNLDGIYEKYRQAGYTPPKIVFWNVRGREGNIPANARQRDVALVSGASPSIIKSVLEGKDFTPTGIMLETLNSERYQMVEDTIEGII